MINDKLTKELQEQINENKNSITGDILYKNNDGTTGDITLNKSIDNYKTLEISYKYQEDYMKTIRVNIETNKSFTLRESYTLNNKFIEIFGAYTCSGNIISKIQGQFGYIDNGAVRIDGQNYFYITRIVGFK